MNVLRHAHITKMRTNKAKTTNNDHGGIGEILKSSSFGKILKGPRIRAAYPKIK